MKDPHQMHKILIRQRGQATMLSFSIFLVFGLWAGFLLLRSESVHRASLKAIDQRHAALSRSRQVAEILNQIALNNRNILASLAMFGNAFSETYNIATFWYKSRVPWKGRNIFGESDIQTHEALSNLVWGDSETSYKVADVYVKLPNVKGHIKIESIVLENFKALSKRSERALKIAAGLTKQNMLLKDELKRVTDNLPDGAIVQSPFPNALCLAIRLGLEKTDIKHNFDSNQQDKSDCWLTDTSEFSGTKILRLTELAKKWTSTHQKDAIGIMHVNQSHAADFFKAIRNTDSSNPESDERLKTFLQLMASPVIKLDGSLSEQRAPHFVITAPTHSDLILKSSCDVTHNIRELLSNVQWQKAIDCNVDLNGLARSFLRPKWVPIVLEFKAWSQI